MPGAGAATAADETPATAPERARAAAAIAAPAVFLLILWNTVKLLAGPAGRCGLRFGSPQRVLTFTGADRRR
ncbi:hypothetical protein GCM10017559_42480 [Streptosporangium longisporum]|uniref:Uncharacterized protein n=1 Tax=Streptosporangium longisporum TaxID=46187 RepID=A0ABN3Y8F9_9ACTN